MLICNYSYINGVLGHQHSGLTSGVKYLKPDVVRNYYSADIYDTTILSQRNRDSFPTGTNPPYSYCFGDKGALLSASNKINGINVVTSNLAKGISVASNISGVGEITSGLSLLTQLASSLAGIGALSGSMVGTIQMASTLAGVGDMTGALSAIVGCASNLAGSSMLTVNLTGTASLEAEISSFTELSPENLANAVWSKQIEGTYTASELMRLLTAIAAGKTTIIDLGGGLATVTFRDINDTQDRVIADMTDSERTTVTLDLDEII